MSGLIRAVSVGRIHAFLPAIRPSAGALFAATNQQGPRVIIFFSKQEGWECFRKYANQMDEATTRDAVELLDRSQLPPSGLTEPLDFGAFLSSSMCQAFESVRQTCEGMGLNAVEHLSAPRPEDRLVHYVLPMHQHPPAGMFLIQEGTRFQILVVQSRTAAEEVMKKYRAIFSRNPAVARDLQLSQLPRLPRDRTVLVYAGGHALALAKAFDLFKGTRFKKTNSN
jgi:hypothetical protein